jgi:uncharacterized membrane protein
VLLIAGLLLQRTPVVHAGLAILIATPLAVLCCLLVEFIRKRERSFALLSIGVLLLLFVSLLLAVP